MASIYKQVGSRYWTARFRMPDGKWVGKSTKQTDRAVAKRMAYEWEGVAASHPKPQPDHALFYFGKVNVQAIDLASF